MLDILVRVSLTLLGAVVGVLSKTYMDRRRLRALLPVVLEQVRLAASRCVQVYSIDEAKAAGASFETASHNVFELVALGVRPVSRWRNGATLLLRTSAAVNSTVTASGDDAAIEALEQLRSHASELLEWLEIAEGKTHG